MSSSQPTRLTRRRVCAALAALPAVAALPARLQAEVTDKPMNDAKRMLARPIPRTGEPLPVIGMGSSGTFDVGTSAEDRAPLADVLRELHGAGGTVIDTSPMYGRSEEVLGDLMAATALRESFWLATKVWTRGREAGERQIAASMQELRTPRLDLLQIHNLLDWEQHVPTLRALQESGKVRYTGLTHYRADAHADLQRVLTAAKFDFVQVNYSLAEREAEQRLLPFCAERGIAVIVNRPFADGAMFSRVKDKPLPAIARDIGAESWGQYFLKWIVGHPAVTCVIPATSKPKHMLDNCGAGYGRLPDAREREAMARDW
jgi:diketogulonate reductase-like aldo/keto reductase